MLLNYYVIITSNLSEYEEISIQYFNEHNKKKSKEFSKFINDCMDKTYAKKIEI
jgi:hypothetical protein